MDGPLPRAAFGVSRVPVTCTVLLHRHHALYSSESHELARKKAATRARGATIAAPPPRWRPWFEEGESNARLTPIRPLLGLFLFSVLTPWARIRQGPKTWHKTKIPCESHDMYACFVLILTYFLHTYICYIL